MGTFKYSTIVKHETNVIANLNIRKSWGVRGGGFLHPLIKSGRDLIHISRHKMRRGGMFTNICCPLNTLRNILSEQGKKGKPNPKNIERRLKSSLEKQHWQSHSNAQWLWIATYILVTSYHNIYVFGKGLGGPLIISIYATGHRQVQIESRLVTPSVPLSSICKIRESCYTRGSMVVEIHYFWDRFG